MKRARIHVYLGTTLVPKRNLQDNETAHDIIEIDIGDNEEVRELELFEQKGVYRQRMETPEEAVKRAQLVAGSRGWVQSLGGEFTGNTTPVPKQITERMKEMTSYRYRLVTCEVTEVIDSGEAEEVQDADIVEDAE